MVAPRDMIGTVIRFDDGKERLLDGFEGEGADKLAYSNVPLDETDPKPTVILFVKPQPFLEMRVLNYKFRVHAEKYPDHPLLMDPERRMELLIEEMMERVRSPRFEYRVPLYRGLLEIALTVLAREFARRFAAGELPEDFLENSAARVRIDENLLQVIEEYLEEDKIQKEFVDFFEHVKVAARSSIARWKSRGLYAPLSTNPLYNLLGLKIEGFINDEELGRIADTADFRALVTLPQIEGLFDFVTQVYFRARGLMLGFYSVPTLAEAHEAAKREEAREPDGGGDDPKDPGSEDDRFVKKMERDRKARLVRQHLDAGLLGCSLLANIAGQAACDRPKFRGLVGLWEASLLALLGGNEDRARKSLEAALGELTGPDTLADRHDVLLKLAGLSSADPARGARVCPRGASYRDPARHPRGSSDRASRPRRGRPPEERELEDSGWLADWRTSCACRPGFGSGLARRTRNSCSSFAATP